MRSMKVVGLNLELAQLKLFESDIQNFKKISHKLEAVSFLLILLCPVFVRSLPVTTTRGLWLPVAEILSSLFQAAISRCEASS